MIIISPAGDNLERLFPSAERLVGVLPLSRIEKKGRGRDSYRGDLA